MYSKVCNGTCELLAASLHFQGMDAGRPNSYKVVFVLDCDGGGGRAAVGSRVCYREGSRTVKRSISEISAVQFLDQRF